MIACSTSGLITENRKVVIDLGYKATMALGELLAGIFDGVSIIRPPRTTMLPLSVYDCCAYSYGSFCHDGDDDDPCKDS